MESFTPLKFENSHTKNTQDRAGDPKHGTAPNSSGCQSHLAAETPAFFISVELQIKSSQNHG